MAKRPVLAVGRWTGGGIVAAARLDREALRALPAGTLLEINEYRPRSDKQNRFLHAILQSAEENSPFGWRAERIKQEVKASGGWFDGVEVELNGRVFVSLRSTADFNREEFSRFTEQVIDFICSDDVCPGMTPADLRRHADDETKAVKR